MKRRTPSNGVSNLFKQKKLKFKHSFPLVDTKEAAIVSGSINITEEKEEEQIYIMSTTADLISSSPSSLEKPGIDIKSLKEDIADLQERLLKKKQELNNSIQTSIRKKIYRDPIHRDIELHPLIVEIIDTKEFQRLRRLKQLGAASYVYAGAVHNRFQHSIGVCYLSGQLLSRIRHEQEELCIDDNDILCIQIAGLCHDLGHGPLSHVFDGEFIPKINPDSTFAHEQASIDMFNYLIEHNNIDILKYNLNEIDLIFIREAIIGTPINKRVGRPLNKGFMYDIVNNIKSGLDVDKLDYFERDSMCAGIEKSFDFSRLFVLAKVLPCREEDNKDKGIYNDIPRICFPIKSIRQVFQLFQTRCTLHEKLYTHHVVKAIELMLTDALIAAEPYVRIKGQNGKLLSLSECINDMKAFSQLDDDILSVICHSDDPNLDKSRKLIERVERRRLYRCVGRSLMKEHVCRENSCPDWCKKTVKDIEIEILYHSTFYNESIKRNNNKMMSSSSYSFALPRSSPKKQQNSNNRYPSELLEHDVTLSQLSQASFYSQPEMTLDDDDINDHHHNNILYDNENNDSTILLENDFCVDFQKIHHGKKNQNPVKHVGFYSKDNISAGFYANLKKYEHMFPSSFQQRFVRMFIKNPKKNDICRFAFERWCISTTASMKKDNDEFSATPPMSMQEYAIY